MNQMKLRRLDVMGKILGINLFHQIDVIRKSNILNHSVRAMSKFYRLLSIVGYRYQNHININDNISEKKILQWLEDDEFVIKGSYHVGKGQYYKLTPEGVKYYQNNVFTLIYWISGCLYKKSG